MRADMEALMARLYQTERALMDTPQQVAALPKVTAPLEDTRTIGKAPTFIGPIYTVHGIRESQAD